MLGLKWKNQQSVILNSNKLQECRCAYQSAVDVPGNCWLWESFGLTSEDFVFAVVTAVFGQTADNRST